jgi:hypothetical protein
MLKKLSVLAALPLLGLLIAPISAAQAAPAAPSKATYSSCAAVKAGGHKVDGEFKLAPLGLNGPKLPVYCANLTGLDPPAAYLTLPVTGPNQNFSQYTAGGASPGTNVRTNYTRLRIDPVPVSLLPLTFRINIADQTYATSTGTLCHSHALADCPAGQLTTSMPYGVGMDCLGANSTAGIGNINLSGTLFNVVDTFVGRSFPPPGAGTATFVSPKIVNLAGGGFCGWIAPADVFDPRNNNLQDPAYDPNVGWDLRVTLLF